MAEHAARLSCPAIALGIALLAVPVFAPASDAQESGERTLALEGGEQLEETLTWTSTLSLEADPEIAQPAIRLPWSIAYEPDDGDGDVHIHVRLLANGETVYGSQRMAEEGGVSSQGPGPEELETEPLAEGTNDIEAIVTVERSGEDRSEARIVAGPLQAESTQPSVPAGAIDAIVALATAGLLGAARAAR